jgi:hypothetical protein
LCNSLILPHGRRPFYDRPLFESSNFEVWPSLGGFIPGWVLIIPKGHLLNLAQLSVYDLPELLTLKEQVEQALRPLGPVIAFEHGPHEFRTSVGCGVDHSHLHLLPFVGSLREWIDRVSTAQHDWRKLSGLVSVTDLGEEAPYFVLEDSRGTHFISGSSIGSQLARRALGLAVNESDRHDWVSFPRLDEVQRTASLISSGCLAA